MRETRILLNCTFLLLLLSPFASTYADNGMAEAEVPGDARAWLDLMSRNMRNINYQGEFTYEHGAQISSLQIFHAVKNGVEYERLVHLDGEPREIVRKGHELTCVHPGSKIVRLEDSIPAGPFSQNDKHSLALLDKYYDFEMLGDHRIAGRRAVLIAINPKDGYRHAHHLYLDKETGLLLKSLLLDSKLRPMERFQFTHIEIGIDIDENDLLAKNDGHFYAHHHDVSSLSKEQGEALGGWAVKWVPAGYSIANNRVQRHQKDDSDNMESYMYTDGLSAFTVFLERTDQSIQGEGVAQRGATVAFTRQLLQKGEKYLVTVVGEIPSLTAEKVASSVRAN